MTFAIFRVMLLGLLRDRGALTMAFVLPPIIYLIFAAIFASTTGDELRLRVAVLDEAKSPITRRLAAAIAAEPSFRPPSRLAASRADIEVMVRSGEADVAVLIRRDPTEGLTAGDAPIEVIGDAARAMAAPIVAGQVQRLFQERLPDAFYRRTLSDVERLLIAMTPEQKSRATAALEAMEKEAAAATASDGGQPRADGRPDPLIMRRDIAVRTAASAAVTYYAGAVGVLFLLFSASQSAMTLIDERRSGIFDRLLSGAGSIPTILAGKMLFLVTQGFLQTTLIFTVASVAYGVAVWPRLLEWTAVSLAAASAAAGLALALCAFCRTRQQAQSLSNFLVLVLSAAGGSMVPRFLMPPWLQDLGWAIPNSWAIEAYHGLLWRNASAAEVLALAALLAAVALVAACAAGFGLARHRA
jgi:ABC-2 type transport system permease protein